jgi:hypothetical protein
LYIINYKCIFTNTTKESTKAATPTGFTGPAMKLESFITTTSAMLSHSPDTFVRAVSTSIKIVRPAGEPLVVLWLSSKTSLSKEAGITKLESKQNAAHLKRMI